MFISHSHLLHHCILILYIFQAKAQRANVLLKMGRLDEAHIDAENVLRKDPEHEDANRVYAGVEVMKVNYFEVIGKTIKIKSSHLPCPTYLGEASRGR